MNLCQHKKSIKLLSPASRSLKQRARLYCESPPHQKRKKKALTLCLSVSVSLQQNSINAKSSSSTKLAPEERRSGPEHRLAHRPSTLPWAPGSTVRRDGPGAFLLDLHNFPDLSKADISRQNPNIQVTMCVCVCPATPAALMLSVARATWLLKRVGQEEQTGSRKTAWCTSLPPFFSPCLCPVLPPPPPSPFTPSGSQSLGLLKQTPAGSCTSASP